MDKPEQTRAYADLSDEALAQLARQDSGAEEYLLKKYKHLVRAKAASYFLIGADREDIVQEGMLGLFKAIRDYRPGRGNFYAFAELCITRQIISAVKAATRLKHAPLNSAVSLQSTFDQSERSLEQMLLPTQSNDPEAILMQRQQYDSMHQAMLQLLSPLEKEVLSMYLKGMSYQEIAQKLHRSEKSVDNALQRIKNKLEEFLP